MWARMRLVQKGATALFQKSILRLSILFLVALERFVMTKLKFSDILMSATAATKNIE